MIPMVILASMLIAVYPPVESMSDSAHVLPSDVFYGLKIWFEDLTYNFISSPQDKTIFLVKESSERLSETLTMVDQGQLSYADVSKSAFMNYISKAYSLSNDINSTSWINANIKQDISKLQQVTANYNSNVSFYSNQMLNGVQGTSDDSNHKGAFSLQQKVDYVNKFVSQIQLATNNKMGNHGF